MRFLRSALPVLLLTIPVLAADDCGPTPTTPTTSADGNGTDGPETPAIDVSGQWLVRIVPVAGSAPKYWEWLLELDMATGGNVSGQLVAGMTQDFTGIHEEELHGIVTGRVRGQEVQLSFFSFGPDLFRITEPNDHSGTWDGNKGAITGVVGSGESKLFEAWPWPPPAGVCSLLCSAGR